MEKKENALQELEHERETEEFGELLIWTALGYISGFAVGHIFDAFGMSRSPVGEWITRTLSGEGESVFEGIFAIKQRISGKKMSFAQIYGWGKLLGLTFPWFIHLFSYLLGIDSRSAEGFFVPYFYAMSDQIGANLLGFIYIMRQEKKISRTVLVYFKNPVMLTSLLIILVVPIGILLVRLLGFYPHTQKLVSLETIISNICWLPPLVGILWEKKRRGKIEIKER